MSSKSVSQIKEDGISKSTIHDLLSAVLVLMLFGISAVNIWLYIEFQKIKFASGIKSSKPYKIVNDILWTLMIAPGAIAFIIGTIIIMTHVVKDQATSGLKGSFSLSDNYNIPLIAIIFSLVLLTILQMVIGYYWPQLKVETINQEYLEFSRALIFTGYLSLPLVLLLVILWIISSIDTSCVNVRKLSAQEEQIRKQLEETQKQLQKVSGEKQKEVSRLTNVANLRNPLMQRVYPVNRPNF